MGVMDKIRSFKAHKPVRGERDTLKGIFHTFKDNKNIIRLVGEFIEVRTHFVAPVPARGERGLCQADAFKAKENRLPQVLNCLDWDIEKEEVRPEKRCPVCKLHEIARMALKESPTPEEKEFLEALLKSSALRLNLKWNIIDRQNPFVTRIDGDKEVKVPGYQIATIGMEAYTDIEGIFEQCKADITDVDEGIDIEVEKGNNGTRTTYSVRAVVDGKSLKVTPLTAEERAMKLHDLKVICGKMVEPQRIIDALHGDYRDLLDINTEEEEVDKKAGGKTDKPAKSAPNVVDEPPAPTDEGDGDGLLDTPPRKRAVESPAKGGKTPVAEKPKVADKPKANPRDWDCFGHIDPEHPECKGCDFKEDCATESKSKAKTK